MRSLWYRLDGHTPVPATVEELAMHPGSTWARVDQDYIGDVSISTVFLCVNHNMWDDGPPLVFETMVFGGSLDLERRRYSTWDEALAGHAEIVELVRAADRAIRNVIGEPIPEPHEE